MLRLLSHLFYTCIAVIFLTTFVFGWIDANRIDEESKRVHDINTKNEPYPKVYYRDGIFPKNSYFDSIYPIHNDSINHNTNY